MRLPGPRRTMRVLLVGLGTATAAALLPAVDSAAATSPLGHLEAAGQAASGSITISGWAYDPGKPGSFSGVDVYLDGRLTGQPPANHPRPDVNRAHHLTGSHGFIWTFAWPMPRSTWKRARARCA